MIPQITHLQLVHQRLASSPATKTRTLQKALQIYESNDITRWELESRILARQGQGLISQSMGLPEKLIRLYLKYFFDVMPHLDHDLTVSTYIIKLSYPQRPTGADVHKLWMHFGFWGGPVVLQEVLDHFKSRDLTDYQYLCDESSVDPNKSLSVRRLEMAIRVLVIEGEEIQRLALSRAYADHLLAKNKSDVETLDSRSQLAETMVTAGMEAYSKISKQKHSTVRTHVA
jgi:hypothetical protein